MIDEPVAALHTCDFPGGAIRGQLRRLGDQPGTNQLPPA